MTKHIEALLRIIIKKGLVFDIRSDANNNDGEGPRIPLSPLHRIVPCTSIRKSLRSASRPYP